MFPAKITAETYRRARIRHMAKKLGASRGDLDGIN